MKKWQVEAARILVVAVSLLAFASIVLWLSGCAGHPPTAIEQRYFTIQTNYSPVVEVRTNVIPVTIIQTNVLLLTNVQGVIEYRTNLIPILAYQTNTVQVTNQAEAYTYTPNQTAKNVGEVGGALGNIFGVGGLITTAIGGLFSLWGWIRSSGKAAAAANLAQTIETVRSFIQQLPNGAVYDSALTTWMQQHQADAGVLNEVLDLLKTEVSNSDANAAADQIRAAIAALNPTILPPKT